MGGGAARELASLGFAGSYQQGGFLKPYRDQPERWELATVRLEIEPGDQAQIE